jgi:nicotinamidase-related amidase
MHGWPSTTLLVAWFFGRGYECLILEDCCGATDHGNHLAAVKMVTMQVGL